MKLIRTLIIGLIICAIMPAHAQTKLDGLYAGCQFSVSPMIGGGMSRSDIVILFRPDGTFTERLGAADWKTHVSGKYQVNGNGITLNYAKSKSFYKIEKGGSLFGYDTQLFKLQGNTISAGYYHFTNGVSGGGGASGMTFVGATSSQGLTFDGKGHFSTESSSATVIAGNNVGGGSSRSNSGNGTYKINQGQLTLTFADGHTGQHSFFCEMGPGTRMAAIDGRIFFSKDEKATATAASSNRTATNKATATPVTAGSSTPTDGKALLLKANSTHGGDKLDNIKTIRFTATVQGLKAVELVDLLNSRVRIELWQGDKLASVDQAEGNTGWHWTGGSKTVLPADKTAGISSSLYGSVLGLRKTTIAKMQVTKIQQVPNNPTYTVACTLNGNNYVFAVNDRNQLVAFGYQAGRQTSSSILSDLRPVQGILIPFHEETTTGQQKLTLQYDDMEVNPLLNAQQWAVPQGN